jgi:hypothetical protein
MPHEEEDRLRESCHKMMRAGLTVAKRLELLAMRRVNLFLDDVVVIVTMTKRNIIYLGRIRKT